MHISIFDMAKKMKIWDNSEELRKELQSIADRFGLPIEENRFVLDGSYTIFYE